MTEEQLDGFYFLMPFGVILIYSAVMLVLLGSHHKDMEFIAYLTRLNMKIAFSCLFISKTFGRYALKKEGEVEEVWKHKKILLILLIDYLNVHTMWVAGSWMVFFALMREFNA